MRKEEIYELSKKINNKITNIDLLQETFQHPSLSNNSNNKSKIKNYERMEFLGDTVLNMIISEELFYKFPNEKEGLLAKRRANLVCGETLYKIACYLDLGKYLKMTPSEKNNGGNKNKNNLENVLEAFIAFIYIDSGIETARDFILKNWNKYILDSDTIRQNYKVILQEKSQQSGYQIPCYEIISKSGLEHDPTFVVQVTINDKNTTGVGKTRKEAEQKAAQDMLTKIKFNSKK